MVRAPCCEKEGLKKGRWTDEEDDILNRYILANGEGSWRLVPKNAGLQRCGKSCRLRWINYLRPDLKRGNITAEEEVLIIKLHASMGNRWSLIAGHLPGRTDNEIKNYWNSHLSRKILAYPTTASKLTVPEPKPSLELTADWNPRRGRSRQLTTSKSSSLISKDTKPSASISENEELEPVTIGKTVQPDTSKESFEITEYINDEGEGEDNTSSLHAEDSLILSSVQKPTYYNDAWSEILCSLNDSSNMKAAEAQTNLSTHNLGGSFLDQNNGSKPSNKLVDSTCATSWNGSKGLSLTSSAGDTWADWDWKGLVNCHKLLDEEEMFSMMWDDGSNLKCNN